jgi:hypothetical protein
MELKLSPLTTWQHAAINNPYTHFAFFAGISCVARDTLIETARGKVRIDQVQENELVWSQSDDGPILVPCGMPYKKGVARLYRVTHGEGEFLAHGRHLIALKSGSYQYVEDLCVGDELCSFFQTQPHSTKAAVHAKSPSSEVHLSQTVLNSSGDCPTCNHSDDRQPHRLSGTETGGIPLISGEPAHNQYGSVPLDVLPTEQEGIHQNQLRALLSNCGISNLQSHQPSYEEGFLVGQKPGHTSQTHRHIKPQFQSKIDCHPIRPESWICHNSLEFSYSTGYTSILKIEQEKEDQEFWDVHIPGTENYFAAGVIHHNTGKTYTGSHFIIKHVLEYPHLTGFIGANNYVQLSTATLRELFYWLTEYGFQFVIDRQPPQSWGQERQFKSYQNVLLIRNPWTHTVSTLFTRVMSDGAPIRGVEFSYGWMDESRDMPQESHDVVLSRLRESNYIKTLITTTPNGEDWSYKRFCVQEYENPLLYGSMHVKTEESVKAGIITEEFYQGLRASYSELMGAQELDALHVNVRGGLAYYAASDLNRKFRAPWGFKYPNPAYPLVVGCDFNFDPAPHIWMVGQISPDGKKMHWFKEISGTRKSTVEMAQMLVSRFPGMFFRVYGDRSGARATTSNAGKPDYDQMAQVFQDAGVRYSLDSDQGNNPLVRNRIENMNRLCKNGLGEVTMTWDPEGCPFLDGDMKMVGWKQNTMKGQGKLDDGGDKQRTHASDGAGYAMWKLFPPGQRGRIIKSLPSFSSQIVG